MAFLVRGGGKNHDDTTGATAVIGAAGSGGSADSPALRHLAIRTVARNDSTAAAMASGTVTKYETTTPVADW